MMDGANLLYVVKAVYVPCCLPSACWVAFRLHGRPTEFSAWFLSPDAGEPIVLDPKMTEAELLSQMDTYRICDFQTLTALFAGCLCGSPLDGLPDMHGCCVSHVKVVPTLSLGLTLHVLDVCP